MSALSPSGDWKMSRTQTEIVGLASNFLELLDGLAPSLVGKGLNVKEIRAIVSEKLENAVKANGQQEELKRALRESSEVVDRTNDELYRVTSGYLDAVIGALGKGSDAANNVARLRSRIRAVGPSPSPVEPVVRDPGTVP